MHEHIHTRDHHDFVCHRCLSRCREDHEVVKCNLDVLVTYGLRQEQQAKVDLKKAQLTCIALQKIVKAEKVLYIVCICLHQLDSLNSQLACVCAQIV